MGKIRTIDTFFKSRNENHSKDSDGNVSNQMSNRNNSAPRSPPMKFRKIATNETNNNSVERDPGLRKQIWDYHVNDRDEIRRAYLVLGAYQPKLSEYKKSGKESHLRSFQYSWFELFPWLEYSPHKDAAFCFPCFLFNKPYGSGISGNVAFFVNGFNSWKRVRNGINCAFRKHVGENPLSYHNVAVKACEDLMNQAQHIPKVIEIFTSEQIANNRLRIIASIDVVKWLALQGCAFRGNDESLDSINRGNFLELLDLFGSRDEKLLQAMDKAPKNATYTSPKIQKEILQIFAIKVKNVIREEIDDAKFCLIVDEARDESKREQMAIILRFVDKGGLVRERFFGIVHVPDTTALTLQKKIYSVLSYHNLDVQNIRGQGYDGASNMRGEFHGLQALVLNDCPYAYYIHCFAHRLQLALVAASKEVVPIHKFFTKLACVVNIVGALCKRNDQLKIAHASDIAYLISIDELESGSGLNQIGNLQRAGDTRWSSHLRSISSLINMYSATCTVLLKIMDEGTSAQQADAELIYESMTSFEFVFILHLMKAILETTDLLCQNLQCKSQDIVNAVQLVSSTKAYIQEFRDDKWDELVSTVELFCKARNIDVPNLDAPYVDRRKRASNQQDDFTIGHHYRVNMFYVVLDSQLQELNGRFNEHAMELLILSSALNPKDSADKFRINDICQLVNKFYPQDFAEHEKIQLSSELWHYEHNVVRHLDYKNLSNVTELCEWLVKTKRSTTYRLVYRVIVLVLTLPVSTATMERSFSAMKTVKSRLRNKMEDDFLNDSLLVYIEKEISKNINTKEIIEAFQNMKERRVLF